MTGTCKSTRYGEGCGHPTSWHVGSGVCCCCNWQQNDSGHVEDCDRCRPILAAYVERRQAEAAPLHAECGHAFGRCRYLPGRTPATGDSPS